MPQRVETTLAQLQIGDYVEGQGGVVWKVTHERNKDGEVFFGITSADGQRKGPILADATPIVRLEYGTPLTEEQVIEAVGGTVLATHDGPSWFHPPHSAFEADEGLLRAHLVRFHAAKDDPSLDMANELGHGDLLVIHHGAHTAGTADHEHGD